MKRPVIIAVGVLSLAALIAGVALLPGAIHRPEWLEPPHGPWRYETMAHGASELDKPGPLSPEERAASAEFLRRLPPRQRRYALTELRDCPAGEFQGRLEGMMGNPPYPPFPWPLVLLFIGSLGIAVTLFLTIRRRDPGVRLERCPHCGRPVEKGWNYCPYCAKMLDVNRDLTKNR